jgi:threonine/homoserine/homoserine lactone efflux protein
MVAIGLGPILQRSDLAYAAIQWGGGLYLMYLGIEAIRQRKIHAEDMRNQGDIAPGVARSMRDGFWVGALNPKGLVFYAAVLPQFVDREKGNVALQLIFLGAVFSILAFVSDGTWGLLAGTARQWLATDAKRLEKLRATGGIVMIILGISVLVSAIVSA